VRQSASNQDISASDLPLVEKSTRNWRDELSARVVNYRKKRARLQPDADPKENFELDFEDIDKPVELDPVEDALGVQENRDSGFDMDIGNPAVAQIEDPAPNEILSPGAPDDEVMELDAPSSGAEEMSLGDPLEKSPPMEIVVGSPTDIAPQEEEDSPQGVYLAPLGRRFLAGLTDAFVLLTGAAVFGIIFWRVCGRMSPAPLNIAVLGFVAVLLIFAYFAVFTSIASATPGLLWMGCDVRNLQGGPPTVRESAWRAFGVLVSLSALMLGFIWACVDSDGLTWHDRMSGTVITQERHADDFAALKVEN
jgi:uncharacterized RDD family membrane protein YckC